MAFAAVLPAAGAHGVAKRKESGVGAALGTEALEQDGVFVVEHRREARRGDIAIGATIDRIAHGHVVGGDRLGHQAGGAGNPEKPVGGLLAGADFRKGAIHLRIQVEFEGLVVSGRFHGDGSFSSAQPSASSSRTNTWLRASAPGGNASRSVMGSCFTSGEGSSRESSSVPRST